MNKEALYHRNESEYSFPLDDKRLKVRLRCAKNDDIKEIYVLWNMCHLIYKEHHETKMDFRCEDELFAYYEAIIEEKIPTYSYVFYIVCNDGSSYYFTEDGVKETYDFRFAHLDSFRYGFINHNDVIRENETFKGDVFYQIFPERFNSANKSKNRSYINRDWDTTDLRSVMGDTIQDIYIGGDLAGINEKLAYIKDLGVDTIYMTPVYKANTNHKYDVRDYYHVDEMFGDDNDLLILIENAHKTGLKIVLDLVFNHSSFLNPIFQDVLKNGKKSKYFNWYFIDGEKPEIKPLNYYTFANVFAMPKLNSNNPEVQKYCADVAKYFLTEYKVDGYRLDVANEVSHDFWKFFKKEVKSVKPDIILIGECWYDSHSFLNNSEWESVMNYPLTNAMIDFYVNHKYDAKVFAEKLNHLLMRHQDATNKMMLNMLDSHDTERFYNKIAPNKDGYLLAAATLIMHVGWPMIYYGDEILMLGGPDPFNRKGMEWKSEEFKGIYHLLFKQLIYLRKLNAVRKGDMHVYSLNNLFCITRYYGDEMITLLINNSEDPIHHSIKEDAIICSNNYKDNTFGKYSYVVYKNDVK